jgi:hypothetical protein
MFKNARLWSRASFMFLILTTLFHSISLFRKHEPQNETEKQLVDLMENYKMDMGSGFNPSMSDLFISLSACMSLLCLFGGLLSYYLIKTRPDTSFLHGILTIMIVIFGICFGVMLAFTFLPPILCMGFISISLILWKWSL